MRIFPEFGIPGKAHSPNENGPVSGEAEEGAVLTANPLVREVGEKARRVAHCANHQFVELGAWQISRLRRKFILEWYPWNPAESTFPAPAPKQSVNRDPLAKAKFYQSLLDTGVVPNRAALARYLGTSRANITQVLRRLHVGSSPPAGPSTGGETAAPPNGGSVTSS
jgi:hypothetical protein